MAVIRRSHLVGSVPTVGLGKTLIALHDINRLLASAKPPAAGSLGKRFLVAAPSQAILPAWPAEVHKFDLSHVLN